MGRKVLISFLGTNNYVSTYYTLGEIRSQRPVRFIQEALVEMLCTDWTEQDRVMIFFTKDSYRLNWLDGGQPQAEAGQKGLQSVLANMDISPLVESYEIPEGFSELEMWGIFDTVLRTLETGDEIYFDVTHAFRSIPIFASTLFNYAQFLKSTVLRGVYYGAFEKLGPAYQVKQMDEQDRCAPIIDMTSMVRVQQLTEAAGSLAKFGRMDQIGKQLSESDIHDDRIEQLLKDVRNAISTLDFNIITSNLPELKRGTYKITLSNSVKKVRQSNLAEPVKALFNKLNEELGDFVAGNDYRNVEAAIRWARRFDMMAQACTLGEEYVVSVVYDNTSMYSPYSKREKKKYRIFLSALLAMPEDDLKAGYYRDPLKGNEELISDLLEHRWLYALRAPYRELSGVRNNLNHANGQMDMKEIKTKFDTAFGNCLRIIHDDGFGE